jgi:hypothetical protein
LALTISARKTAAMQDRRLFFAVLVDWLLFGASCDLGLIIARDSGNFVSHVTFMALLS